MANEIVLKLSIIVIIILSIIILQGLVYIYYQTKNWRMLSLMLIPFAFSAIYLYIGVYNPPIEIGRNIVRLTIIFNSCIAVHVIWTHIFGMLGEKKKKREVSNKDAIS